MEVREDVTIQIGERSRRFRRVRHERCEACGERIFGIEASKAFDAAVLKAKGRSAA